MAPFSPHGQSATSAAVLGAASGLEGLAAAGLVQSSDAVS